MKRMILIAVLLLVLSSSAALARDPLSPLYEACLEATLTGWEKGFSVRGRCPEDDTGWPVSLAPISMCVGSACLQSYCFGSLCAESMCLGSGCLGSACLGSGCLGSVCTVSGCVGVTLCLKQCGHSGGPPQLIDPTSNGTTFVHGSCNEM